MKQRARNPTCMVAHVHLPCAPLSLPLYHVHAVLHSPRPCTRIFSLSLFPLLPPSLVLSFRGLTYLAHGSLASHPHVKGTGGKGVILAEFLGREEGSREESTQDLVKGQIKDT